MGIFDTVAGMRPRKSKFNLSHEKTLTMNMGDLVPALVQEIMPGDQMRVSTEVFMRLAPMLAPIMHRVDVSVHHFFVPNRIIYDGWEPFITGGRNGTQTEWPTPPAIDPAILKTLTVTNTDQRMANGSLWDYMGLPTTNWVDTQMTGHAKVNMIPFFAYQKIYDEYFRDPNIMPSLFDSESGVGQILTNEYELENMDQAMLINLMTLRKRCWEKDYFTTALPWAQRGTAIEVPLDGVAQVNYLDTSIVRRDNGGSVGGTRALGTTSTEGNELRLNDGSDDGGARIENIDTISLDASGVTINDLRRSIRVQEWLEKNARAGYRYVEQLLSHFGVRSSDKRLQRPEYLGGGKINVKISEVLSTYGDDTASTTQVGDMYGHGMSYGTGGRFKMRQAEEHGYVISLISVMPKTAYQQGIPKEFTRLDKFDYPWPEFAHLGEQPVVSKELYFDFNDPDANEGTFGYQQRYVDYKQKFSTVHGDFKDSLDFWKMTRIFESRPNLNAAFLRADPTTRIWSVEEEEYAKLYVQIYNKIDAVRPLPYYGVPTI